MPTTAPKCQWTASVCTGASLYAAAGLLKGKKTATHWAFRDVVRAYGLEVVAERVVWQGNHISAAGVSAGIDMALALTERVHGLDLAKALQLVIEYDPQPPFDSGSLEKADPATKRLAMQVLTAGVFTNGSGGADGPRDHGRSTRSSSPRALGSTASSRRSG